MVLATLVLIFCGTVAAVRVAWWVVDRLAARRLRAIEDAARELDIPVTRGGA